MARTRDTRLSLRLTEAGMSVLDRLAKGQKITKTECVERLIAQADADPHGYYLRMAALNAWIAAMLSTAVAQKVLGEHALPIIQDIEADGQGIVGPLPHPPAEVLALADRDNRIAWLLEAYGIGLTRNRA